MESIEDFLKREEGFSRGHVKLDSEGPPILAHAMRGRVLIVNERYRDQVRLSRVETQRSWFSRTRSKTVEIAVRDQRFPKIYQIYYALRGKKGDFVHEGSYPVGEIRISSEKNNS